MRSLSVKGMTCENIMLVNRIYFVYPISSSCNFLCVLYFVCLYLYLLDPRGCIMQIKNYIITKCTKNFFEFVMERNICDGKENMCYGKDILIYNNNYQHNHIKDLYSTRNFYYINY